MTTYYTTFCFGKANKYMEMSITSLFNQHDGVTGDNQHNNTSTDRRRVCDQHGDFTIHGDSFEKVYSSLSNDEKEMVEGFYIVKYPNRQISAQWRRINNKFVTFVRAYAPLKRQQKQIDDINKTRKFIEKEIVIDASDIWQAEDKIVIGSKVGNSAKFRAILTNDFIQNHDYSKDRVEGQMFVSLTMEQIKESQITCGIGLRSAGFFENQVKNYVMREWRGQVSCFLKREYALPVAKCAVIIYTRQAYLADPQISQDERARVEASTASHYLVALLANAEGVPNARSPYRLVDCLAGGNNEAAQWSVDEIREYAKETMEYTNKYSVVAD